MNESILLHDEQVSFLKNKADAFNPKQVKLENLN